MVGLLIELTFLRHQASSHVIFMCFFSLKRKKVELGIIQVDQPIRIQEVVEKGGDPFPSSLLIRVPTC